MMNGSFFEAEAVDQDEEDNIGEKEQQEKDVNDGKPKFGAKQMVTRSKAVTSNKSVESMPKEDSQLMPSSSRKTRSSSKGQTSEKNGNNNDRNKKIEQYVQKLVEEWDSALKCTNCVEYKKEMDVAVATNQILQTELAQVNDRVLALRNQLDSFKNKKSSAIPAKCEPITETSVESSRGKKMSHQSFDSSIIDGTSSTTDAAMSTLEMMAEENFSQKNPTLAQGSSSRMRTRGIKRKYVEEEEEELEDSDDDMSYCDDPRDADYSGESGVEGNFQPHHQNNETSRVTRRRSNKKQKSVESLLLENLAEGIMDEDELQIINEIPGQPNCFFDTAGCAGKTSVVTKREGFVGHECDGCKRFQMLQRYGTVPDPGQSERQCCFLGTPLCTGTAYLTKCEGRSGYRCRRCKHFRWLQSKFPFGDQQLQPQADTTVVFPPSGIKEQSLKAAINKPDPQPLLLGEIPPQTSPEFDPPPFYMRNIVVRDFRSSQRESQNMVEPTPSQFYDPGVSSVSFGGGVAGGSGQQQQYYNNNQWTSLSTAVGGGPSQPAVCPIPVQVVLPNGRNYRPVYPVQPKVLPVPPQFQQIQRQQQQRPPNAIPTKVGANSQNQSRSKARIMPVRLPIHNNNNPIVQLQRHFIPQNHHSAAPPPPLEAARQHFRQALTNYSPHQLQDHLYMNSEQFVQYGQQQFQRQTGTFRSESLGSRIAEPNLPGNNVSITVKMEPTEVQQQESEAASIGPEGVQVKVEHNGEEDERMGRISQSSSFSNSSSPMVFPPPASFSDLTGMQQPTTSRASATVLILPSKTPAIDELLSGKSGPHDHTRPKRQVSISRFVEEDEEEFETAGEVEFNEGEEDETLMQSDSFAEPVSEIASNGWPKPQFSYSCLAALALKNSETGELTVSEIYAFIREHFPYFCAAPLGWKNSIRHNLSLNRCFQKIEIEIPGMINRKACLWRILPSRMAKMDAEIRKWRERARTEILASMAHSEAIDQIVAGRMGMPPELRKKLSAADSEEYVQIPAMNFPNKNNGNSSGTQQTRSEVLKMRMSKEREPKVIVRQLINGFGSNNRFRIYTNTHASTAGERKQNKVVSQKPPHQNTAGSVERKESPIVNSLVPENERLRDGDAADLNNSGGAKNRQQLSMLETLHEIAALSNANNGEEDNNNPSLTLDLANRESSSSRAPVEIRENSTDKVDQTHIEDSNATDFVKSETLTEEPMELSAPSGSTLNNPDCQSEPHNNQRSATVGKEPSEERGAGSVVRRKSPVVNSFIHEDLLAWLTLPELGAPSGLDQNTPEPANNADNQLQIPQDQQPTVGESKESEKKAEEEEAMAVDTASGTGSGVDGNGQNVLGTGALGQSEELELTCSKSFIMEGGFE